MAILCFNELSAPVYALAPWKQPQRLLKGKSQDPKQRFKTRRSALRGFLRALQISDFDLFEMWSRHNPWIVESGKVRDPSIIARKGSFLSEAIKYRKDMLQTIAVFQMFGERFEYDKKQKKLIFLSSRHRDLDVLPKNYLDQAVTESDLEGFEQFIQEMEAWRDTAWHYDVHEQYRPLIQQFCIGFAQHVLNVSMMRVQQIFEYIRQNPSALEFAKKVQTNAYEGSAEDKQFFREAVMVNNARHLLENLVLPLYRYLKAYPFPKNPSMDIILQKKSRRGMAMRKAKAQFRKWKGRAEFVSEEDKRRLEYEKQDKLAVKAYYHDLLSAHRRWLIFLEHQYWQRYQKNHKAMIKYSGIAPVVHRMQTMRKTTIVSGVSLSLSRLSAFLSGTGCLNYAQYVYRALNSPQTWNADPRTAEVLLVSLWLMTVHQVPLLEKQKKSWSDYLQATLETVGKKFNGKDHEPLMLLRKALQIQLNVLKSGSIDITTAEKTLFEQFHLHMRASPAYTTHFGQHMSVLQRIVKPQNSMLLQHLWRDIVPDETPLPSAREDRETPRRFRRHNVIRDVEPESLDSGFPGLEEQEVSDLRLENGEDSDADLWQEPLAVQTWDEWVKKNQEDEQRKAAAQAEHEERLSDQSEAPKEQEEQAEELEESRLSPAPIPDREDGGGSFASTSTEDALTNADSGRSSSSSSSSGSSPGPHRRARVPAILTDYEVALHAAHKWWSGQMRRLFSSNSAKVNAQDLARLKEKLRTLRAKLGEFDRLPDSEQLKQTRTYFKLQNLVWFLDIVYLQLKHGVFYSPKINKRQRDEHTAKLKDLYSQVKTSTRVSQEDLLGELNAFFARFENSEPVVIDQHAQFVLQSA